MRIDASYKRHLILLEAQRQDDCRDYRDPDQKPRLVAALNDSGIDYQWIEPPYPPTDDEVKNKAFADALEIKMNAFVDAELHEMEMRSNDIDRNVQVIREAMDEQIQPNPPTSTRDINIAATTTHRSNTEVDIDTLAMVFLITMFTAFILLPLGMLTTITAAHIITISLFVGPIVGIVGVAIERYIRTPTTQRTPHDDLKTVYLTEDDAPAFGYELIDIKASTDTHIRLDFGAHTVPESDVMDPITIKAIENFKRNRILDDAAINDLVRSVQGIKSREIALKVQEKEADLYQKSNMLTDSPIYQQIIDTQDTLRAEIAESEDRIKHLLVQNKDIVDTHLYHDTERTTHDG